MNGKVAVDWTTAFPEFCGRIAAAKASAARASFS
jgi:hypothetical protein